MKHGEALKGAARDRLFTAELAAVLEVPIAAIGVAHPRRRSSWLAAALVLFGVSVAGGVAWLRAEESASTAQEPGAFDPVFPQFEQSPELVHAVGAEGLRKVADDVEALSVQVDGTMDVLAALQRCRRLKHLFIQGSGEPTDLTVRRETLRTIASLPLLEYLALPYRLQVTPDELRELRAASRLQSLMLSGPSLVLDAELAAVLVELPKLRNVSVWEVRLKPEGIAALAGLPDLESLMLGRASWDASCIEALGSLRRLRALVLHGAGESGYRQHLQRLALEQVRELARLPRLAVLALESLSIDDAALGELPGTLQRISIGDIDGCTPKGLLSLARLPKLRALGLKNHSTDAWWRDAEVDLVRELPLERFDSMARPVTEAMWEELQKKPKLRGLGLNCPDSGAVDLGPCAKLLALERLMLFLPKEFTPETLEPLRGLPKLRQVIVIGNMALSEAERQRLTAFVVRTDVELLLR